MPVIEGHFVVSYAYQAGFGGSELTMATAISRSETGWNTDYLFKGPETEQRGLWGINWVTFPQYDRLQLMDPTYNAIVAYNIYRSHGSQWGDWQSYLDGTYAQSLDAAQQAVNEFISLGGDPNNPPAPTPPSNPPPSLGGSYPILGNWDPTPAMRQFGDNLYIVANSLDAVSNAIQRLH